MLAAHQADRAQMKACLAQMRQAAQAGVPRHMQDCIPQGTEHTRALVDKRFTEDTSVYGRTVRAARAATFANMRKDREEALRQYAAISADVAAIEEEISRVTPQKAQELRNILEIAKRNLRENQARRDIESGRIQIIKLLCEQADKRSEFAINPATETVTHTIISPTQGSCTASYVNGRTGTVVDSQSCPPLGGILQIYQQIVQISGSNVTWRTIPVKGFAAADETESIDLSTNAATWTDNSGARFRCSRQR